MPQQPRGAGAAAGRRLSHRRSSTSAASRAVIGRCRASPARSSAATSRLGGRERAVHAADEVADQLRRHRQLPVGEELDQHRRQQRVVRRLEPRHRRRAAAGSRDRAARSASAPARSRPLTIRLPPPAARWLQRWKSASSAVARPPASRSTSSTASAASPRQRREVERRPAPPPAGSRAPLRAAQTCARWVLPAPARPGHRQPPARPGRPAVDLRQRQPFDGETKKSARPSAGRAGRSSTSCRGAVKAQPSSGGSRPV